MDLVKAQGLKAMCRAETASVTFNSRIFRKQPVLDYDICTAIAYTAVAIIGFLTGNCSEVYIS